MLEEQQLGFTDVVNIGEAETACLPGAEDRERAYAASSENDVTEAHRRPSSRPNADSETLSKKRATVQVDLPDDNSEDEKDGARTLRRKDSSAVQRVETGDAKPAGPARSGTRPELQSRKSIFMDADMDMTAQKLAMRFGESHSAVKGMRSSRHSLHIGTHKSLGGHRVDELLSKVSETVDEMRLAVWLVLEEPFGTRVAICSSTIMVSVILLSIVHAVQYPTPLNLDVALGPWDATEMAFNIIFVMEVLVRVWVHPCRRRWLKEPANAIDLCAVLPFLLNEVVDLHHRVAAGFAQVSTFEAFLRLLKLSRYFWGWQLLFRALSDALNAMIIPLFFLMLIVLFGSCLMLAIEEDYEGHTITDLPTSIYFCFNSVVSINVGPFYELEPVSLAGRLIAAILMMVGVMFMAMPIAIVGTCFSQTWFDQDRIILIDKVRTRLEQQGYEISNLREVFDELDEDGSGEIEFSEFKRLIEAFHLFLNISKMRELFKYFDVASTGAITYEEFVCALYPESFIPDDEDDYDEQSYFSESEEEEDESEEDEDEQVNDNDTGQEEKPKRGSVRSARGSVRSARGSIRSARGSLRSARGSVRSSRPSGVEPYPTSLLHSCNATRGSQTGGSVGDQSQRLVPLSQIAHEANDEPSRDEAIGSTPSSASDWMPRRSTDSSPSSITENVMRSSVLDQRLSKLSESSCATEYGWCGASPADESSDGIPSIRPSIMSSSSHLGDLTAVQPHDGRGSSRRLSNRSARSSGRGSDPASFSETLRALSQSVGLVLQQLHLEGAGSDADGSVVRVAPPLFGGASKKSPATNVGPGLVPSEQAPMEKVPSMSKQNLFGKVPSNRQPRMEKVPSNREGKPNSRVAPAQRGSIFTPNSTGRALGGCGAGGGAASGSRPSPLLKSLKSSKAAPKPKGRARSNSLMPGALPSSLFGNGVDDATQGGEISSSRADGPRMSKIVSDG